MEAADFIEQETIVLSAILGFLCLDLPEVLKVHLVANKHEETPRVVYVSLRHFKQTSRRVYECVLLCHVVE